ncbi:hypothetical protein F5148DRAFT_1296273 [Russula earlei]|uniref:Uncharacterized protein n=1 Tax=Russula earlei TaxID=71964 RepID=A0ACC0TQ79_9AGAM|nr:hypothetical protein F5148DRAFT_1296273 [Russula earlei]
MHRKLPFILLISLICAGTACTKVDVNFGGEFVDNSLSQIIKTDTIAPVLSTVYLDSFPTSAKGVTLVGGYTDPIFGRIDTKTYLEVAPPSTSAPYTNATFDSLSIIFKINHTYYGDTTKPVHIDVYQLSDYITPPITSSSLYNIDQFPVSNFLGGRDILISPTKVYPYPGILPTDTFTIRLSDALGKTLLKKLQTPGDPDMISAATFLQYFKGLRISSNAATNLVLGCKDSVIMRLSYQKADLYPVHLNADFVLSNSSHHFTNISVNRTGTPLATLPLKKVILSTAPGADSAAYTQAAAGAMTKITFPTLRSVLQAQNFVSIVKAVLIVRPVKGTYDNGFYLPSQLNLATTDLYNQPGGALSAPSAVGGVSSSFGTLYLDYLGENTGYTYDISSYIKAIVNDPSPDHINNNGLLLVPPSPAFETQFSRIVVGNSFNAYPYNKIELQVYYAAVTQTVP